MRYFFLLFICFNSLGQSSQFLDIKGRVIDKENNPLDGANVTLHSVADSIRIRAYSITGLDGRFHIKFQLASNLYIKISFIGFKEKKIYLTSKSIDFDNIILEESSQNLREVVVSINEIRDTTTLKIDTLKFSNDSKLREILKDNKEIEVNDQGGISFQGIPINKILINKKAVFINQNTLALDNLTNEMIEKIQVVSNYKNKFNVDFDNFTETVLNVDTKNNFRGILKGITEGGLGHQEAATIKSNLFFFSDKLNVFFTQNTNNIQERGSNRNEVSSRYEGNASTFYTSKLTTLIDGEENVRNDKFNSTYLLLKQEKESSLKSLNLGFNFSEWENFQEIVISNQDMILTTEKTTKNESGNFLYADFNFKKLQKEKTLLNYNLNLDLLNVSPSWTTDKEVFSTQQSFNNTSNLALEDFLLKNSFSTKKNINSKFIWEIEITHFLENITYDINALTISNTFSQSLKQIANQLIGATSVSYKKNNLLNIDMKASISRQYDRLYTTIEREDLLKREVNILNNTFVIRGQTKKINYFVKAGFQKYFFLTQNKKSHLKFPASISFNYRISNKKSINISFENTYTLENIENSLPLLLGENFNFFQTFDTSLKQNVNNKQNAVLHYAYGNIAKSSYANFLFSFTRSGQFSQDSFTSFDDNFNFFQKDVFDEWTTTYSKISYAKELYFSKKDHRFQFGSSISAFVTNNEIRQDSKLMPLNIKQAEFEFKIGFIPQNLFFNELSLTANFITNNFFIQNEQVNTNLNAKYSFLLEGNQNE